MNVAYLKQEGVSSVQWTTYFWKTHNRPNITEAQLLDEKFENFQRAESDIRQNGGYAFHDIGQNLLWVFELPESSTSKFSSPISPEAISQIITSHGLLSMLLFSKKNT
jgi:hypothetical protein